MLLKATIACNFGEKDKNEITTSLETFSQLKEDQFLQATLKGLSPIKVFWENGKFQAVFDIDPAYEGFYLNTHMIGTLNERSVTSLESVEKYGVAEEHSDQDAEPFAPYEEEL